MHRYLLKELATLYTECSTHFLNYQFKKGLELLYSFCDKTLSNFYFESVKNTMYLKSLDSVERKLTQAGLYEVLLNLFDLVKVYCPFVAEEFYQDFYSNKTNSSVFYQQHLLNNHLVYLNYNTVYNWDMVNDYRKQVQCSLEPYQKNKTLKSRTEAAVTLNLNQNEYTTFYDFMNNYKTSDLF
jgi:isoleucyl-tRNA synthetase